MSDRTPRPAADAPHPDPFVYGGTELDAMAHAVNYNRWIVERFHRYIGSRVVEIGAGIGTISALLAARPDLERLLLLEPDPTGAERLRKRFHGDPRVAVEQRSLTEPLDGAFDAAILVNVLEHVADDIGLLRHARLSLRPGGHVLVFVPAGPWLYGTLDQAFDHVRRYSPAMLAEHLAAAGLQIMDLRYTNPIGMLGWYVSGRLLRRTTLGPREVRLFDSLVVPWLRRLEAVVRPPIGQNLIAVARRSREERA